MSRPSVTEAERLKLISEGCNPKTVSDDGFFNLGFKFDYETLVFYIPSDWVLH